MTSAEVRRLSAHALLQLYDSHWATALPEGRFAGATWPVPVWPFWRGKVFTGSLVQNLIGPFTAITGKVRLDGGDVLIEYGHGLTDIVRPVTDSLWLGQFILGGVTVWFTLEKRQV